MAPIIPPDKSQLKLSNSVNCIAQWKQKILGLKGQTDEKPSYLFTGVSCLLERELVVSVVKYFDQLFCKTEMCIFAPLHGFKGLLGISCCLDLYTKREKMKTPRSRYSLKSLVDDGVYHSFISAI